MAAIAPRAIKAATRAYSIRSCPDSSVRRLFTSHAPAVDFSLIASECAAPAQRPIQLSGRSGNAIVRAGLRVLGFGARRERLRGWPIHGRRSGRRSRLYVARRVAALGERDGGGGGSRTRVRNRCQPRDSMLSPFSSFAPGAQSGQETPETSPMISSPPHGPSGGNQPAVRRPSVAHRRSHGERQLN